MLRKVQATRYALALREGGSLPAIVEADDLGLYVVKFRGAGQGPLALVAELVAGEIGRVMGLPIPELLFIEVDPILGRNEPDSEIRQLLKASAGINVALDYLPGSVMFDSSAGDKVSPEVASLTAWFDAFVQNVDRTARNPNLLMWHRTPYLIDHGAALYFHHNWERAAQKTESPFPEIQHHLLLPWASAIPAASIQAQRHLNRHVLSKILSMVPDEWIALDTHTAEERRGEYLDYFLMRLAASQSFEEEAIRAHSLLV
jgi:hypothetical protein